VHKIEQKFALICNGSKGKQHKVIKTSVDLCSDMDECEDLEEMPEPSPIKYPVISAPKNMPVTMIKMKAKPFKQICTKIYQERQKLREIPQ